MAAEELFGGVYPQFTPCTPDCVLGASLFLLLFDASFIHFGVCAFYCDSPLVFFKIY